MEEQKRLSFFKKMALAITDFRIYPYVLKTESVWKSFGYFIKLLLIVVLLMSTYFCGTIFSNVESFIENYNNIVPEFKFKNGVLSVEETKNFKVDADTFLVIDTTQTYDEYSNSNAYMENTRYDARIFVNSDAISYEDYQGSGFKVMLKDMDCSFDKASLYSYVMTMYENPWNKCIIFLTVYVAVFVGYFISKIFEVLIIALIASVICTLFRMKINTKNYFKIAFYAVTLPYLVEAISIMCVGSIKEYTVVVTTLLTYIYVFYAIRAIKLDAFLLIVTNAQNKDGKVVITRVDKDGNLIKDTDDENKVEESEDPKNAQEDLDDNKDNNSDDNNNDNNDKKDNE